MVRLNDVAIEEEKNHVSESSSLPGKAETALEYPTDVAAVASGSLLVHTPTTTEVTVDGVAVEGTFRL